MREVNTEELKQIEYKMLVDFAEFCEKNDIRYFLSSGTLLGAVRHQGFIPWDDDIDVMLPRKDYERAVRLYKRDAYFIDDRLTNPACRGRCGKLKYKNSFLESKDEYEDKIFIDIFPMDGIESNPFIRKLKLSVLQVFIACHMSTITKYQQTNRYADKNAGFLNWKKHSRTFFKYLLISTVGHTDCKIWIRWINEWLKKVDFDSAEYVGYFAGGYYGSKEVMPRAVFENRVRVTFEDRDFWAPADYDRYLRRLYGNYMELPAVEKRQPHHTFKAFVEELSEKKVEDTLALQHEHAKQVLECVSAAFDRNHISYFLLAGSCLGAVRHKGFIPWDDDIDVGVLNKDYARAESILSRELPEKFTWISTDTSETYPRMFGKILYNGVPCLDVFRLVKMPRDKKKRAVKWLTRNFLVKIYARKCSVTFGTESAAAYWVSKVVSLFFSRNAVLKLCRWNERRYCDTDQFDYVNMYSYYGLKRELIARELTEVTTLVEFEGKCYPTFGDTHAYLTNLYGDYMSPVRIGEQQPMHMHNIFV